MQPGNPIVGGTVLRRPAIQSPNYVAGTSGWAIFADGTAEFNGVTIRGIIDVIDTGSGVEVKIANQAPAIQVTGPTGGEQWVRTRRTADAPTSTATRFYMTIDGDLSWGAGGSVTDTRLRRTASGQLTLDGNLLLTLLSATTVSATSITATGATITNNAIQQADDTAVSGSTTSLTYTDTLTGASGVLAITFTAPPSGLVAISHNAQGSNSSGYIGTTGEVWTGNIVGGGSKFYAAADQDATFQSGNPAAQRVGAMFAVSGLTPGDPYYVKMMHRVNAGTGNAIRRKLVLIPSL